MRYGMNSINPVTVAVVSAMTSAASAGIVGFVGDTTHEGGWYAFEDEFDVDMTLIHHGGSPYETVISIEVPEFGGSLDFDAAHSLRHIGQGWATWSHGYTGEVFYTNGAFSMGYDVNMDNAYAFDAYAEPNADGGSSFFATAYGSAGGEVSVEFQAFMCADARHFGFYAEGERIIRVEVTATGDFAIGEWRVGLPAPGAIALMGFAGIRFAGRRRCTQNQTQGR